MRRSSACGRGWRRNRRAGGGRGAALRPGEPAALSEAGLPLANLAFGEALRYARATGPSEELWDAIPGQVLRAPSPLMPGLLDQLEALAGTNTALQAGVEAWRTLWNARLKLYDIADAVRQTGKLRGLTTANFWIEYDQTRWLCILNPEHGSTLEQPQSEAGPSPRMRSGRKCGSCPNPSPSTRWCGRWRIRK